MSAVDLFTLTPDWQPLPRIAVRAGDDHWWSTTVDYDMRVPRTFWTSGSLSGLTTVTEIVTLSSGGGPSVVSFTTLSRVGPAYVNVNLSGTVAATLSADGAMAAPIGAINPPLPMPSYTDNIVLPGWQAASNTSLIAPRFRYIADFYLPQTMAPTVDGANIEGWTPLGAPTVFGWWDPATALAANLGQPVNAATTELDRVYVPALADAVLATGDDGAFPLHFGEGATCHDQPPINATAALANARNAYGTYVYDNRGPPQAYYFGTYGTKVAGLLGNSGCTNRLKDGIPGPSMPCVFPVWLSDGYNGYDEGVPRDCEVLLGRLPDCPSTASTPGACQFSLFYTGLSGAEDVLFGEERIGSDLSSDILSRSIAYKTIDPCYSLKNSYPAGVTLVADKPFQSAWCVKTDFDVAWRKDCCLGRFANASLSDGSPALLRADGAGADVDLGGVYCDPRWHPSDPVGECIPVFASVCSTSVLPDGSTVSALADEGHPCGQWYSQVVLGQPLWDPTNEERWTVVDELVQSYCSENPAAPECACAAFDPYKCATEGGCFAYASVSDGSPAAQPCGGGGATGGATGGGGAPPVSASVYPGVRRAQFAAGDTLAPLSWSDYVCTDPRCAVTVGSDGVPSRPQSGGQQIETLLTSDVLLRMTACPNQICGQIVADECIEIGSVTANSVYIGNTVELCTGSGAVIDQNAPSPVAEPFTLVVIDLANEQSPFALGGTINVQNTNGTFNFQARVGATTGQDAQGHPFAPWPAWLVLETTQGSVGANQSFDVPLNVDLTRAQGPVVPSAFSLQLILQDTVYPAVTLAVTILVRVYLGSVPPAPPVNPNPAPQPGTDRRVIQRTQATAWQTSLFRATLVALAACLVLVLFSLVVAWFLRRKAERLWTDGARLVAASASATAASSSSSGRRSF